MNVTKDLNVDFYEAPDGPRLLIFGSMDADFRSLRSVFRKLSLEPGLEIELKGASFIRMLGELEISLRSTEDGRHRSSRSTHGFRLSIERGSHHFTWTRTPEGWAYLVGLIDGVLKSDFPCHQYLASSPEDDATVELSKGEVQCDEEMSGKSRE